MRLLGLTYSTSLNATMIQFIGGPFDGDSGLFDSAFMDSVQFSDPTERVTHRYVPIQKGLPQYRFDESFLWSKS